jgi:hypothetical protein
MAVFSKSRLFQHPARAYNVYPGIEQPANSPPGDYVLDSGNFEGVKNGQGVVIAFGTIYYDDIFKNSWKSDFCFYFRWADINEPTKQSNSCRNHQGSDDEAEEDRFAN